VTLVLFTSAAGFVVHCQGKQSNSLIRFRYDFRQMKANTQSAKDETMFLEKQLDVSAKLVLQQGRDSS